MSHGMKEEVVKARINTVLGDKSRFKQEKKDKIKEFVE